MRREKRQAEHERKYVAGRERLRQRQRKSFNSLPKTTSQVFSAADAAARNVAESKVAAANE
jgi:hypothetical protein